MPKAQVNYVDGYVLIVKKKNVAKYKKVAKEAGKIWMKHGALSYQECMMDDPNPASLHMTFAKISKAKADDTVWFSYIEYKSKKHRDQVNKKVEKEMMELNKDNPDHMKNMPFDMRRIAFGGFKVNAGL